MNKKGGLGDGIFFVVAIFVIALVLIITWTIFDSVNTQFQNTEGVSDDGKEIMSSLNGKFVSIMDNSFLLIFIGLFIAIVAGAFFIRTHPALFWISVPVVVFLVFLAAIYGNFFNNFITTDPNVTAAANDFTIVTFILNNYVWAIVIVIFVLIIALYAKNNVFSQTQ